MSDPVVVTIIKARLAAVVPATPVIDTLNTRPASLPAHYCTVQRDFSSVARISLGGSPNTQFRETGTITISVTVKSGTGTSEAEMIAEQVRNAFHNYALVHFQVLVVDSPVVGSPDDGNWFQLDVPVQYLFDFFK